MSNVVNRRLGILQYQDGNVSGENTFIYKILPQILQNKEQPILFDVGLNEGRYSKKLLSTFPTSRIYGFEPGAATLGRAKARLAAGADIVLEPMAVSDADGEIEIYDYADKDGSSHVSPYKEVLTEQHHAIDTVSYRVPCVSLDRYFIDHGVVEIDFIKIDTEGHEISVLRGCSKLLQEGRIGVVQFEFNEMNVISRTFLRDFYTALEDFVFYRLRSDGLIPLGKCDAKNEIIKFQNIIAISPMFTGRENTFVIENPWR